MKPKTTFICSECGYSSAKWYGKCPSCGKWNTMEETEAQPETELPKRTIKRISPETESSPVRFDELSLPDVIRQPTGMSELDRVLGGGLVQGSVVLLAGEPASANRPCFCRFRPASVSRPKTPSGACYTSRARSRRGS